MSLIELAQRGGGELGLTLVRERSNKPLLRLTIPSPPRKPHDLTEPANVLRRAQRGSSARQAYNVRIREWRDLVEQSVPPFLEHAKTLLLTTADAPKTDLWGAIARCDAFLSEADSAWAAPTQRYLLVLSDGDDTVGRPAFKLRSGASVMLIPGTTSGDLSVLQPEKFESAAAAFRVLAARQGGAQ